LTGPTADADVREYDTRDGLLATEGIKRDRSVVSDSHGRIWLSTTGGISVVDPGRLTVNALPVVVHVQSVLADGVPVDLGRAVRIPPMSKRIIFNYTGLSLSSPERIRYRYSLDGLDRTWSAPTTATEAGYSNLGPGSYRFHVAASNADGVWNGAEAVIPFQVEPMFWQTVWFYIAVAFSCGVAILGLYRYRMRQLSLRFEERLGERERIARELHDTLLQGFQGLTLHFQAAMKQIPEREQARHTMEKALKCADEVLLEGRKRVRDLRAERVISNELPEMLAGYGKELAQGLPVAFKVTVVGSPLPLHPVAGDEIYRIAREALTNAFRHSKAAKIEVEIVYDSVSLGCRVRDNGCGIIRDVLTTGRDGHWGLAGMRERSEKIGGQLKVWSNPGTGTEVDFRIPAKLAYLRKRKEPKWGWIKLDSNGRKEAE
jgi:signal transduction histidine kinase